MSQSKPATKPVVDETLKAEHPVADKIKGTLHQSVDTLVQKVGSAEETLRGTAQSSSENLALKQIEIQEKWNSSPIKKYAIENPVAAAGIAFSVGMLVSSLLKRK